MRALKIVLVGGLCVLPLVAASDAQAQRRGSQAEDLDPQGRGAIGGVGIESRDIEAMTDKVVRELVSRPDLVSATVPPRIVVDSEKFYNNSSQRIDREMITDALRANFNRAAAGRIRFVSRESMDIVLRERELKRTGQVDVGTKGMTRAPSGVDYQMIGKISSLDSRDAVSGMQQRRTQIIFELVDLETADLIWTSEPYVILRAGGVGVVYR